MQSIKAFFWVFILIAFLFNSALSQEKPDRAKNVRIMGMVVPTHSSETGWSATAGAIMTFKTQKQDTLLRPSALYLLAMASQNKQYRFSHGGDVVMPHEKWILSYNLAFSFYTDFFYTISQQKYVSERDKIKYRINSGYVSAVNQVVPHVFCGAIGKVELISRVEYTANSLFAQQLPTGYNGYSVLSLSPRIFFDSRNNIQWASSGWYVEPIAQWFHYTPDSLRSFFIGGLDVRCFTPFRFGRRFVLSNQMLSLYASKTTAFRFLPTDVGRAWQYNQFKDYFFWCSRNDLRYNVWRGVWIACFADISQTARSPRYLSKSELRACAGPGLRLKLSPTEESYFRIDFGFGKDNWNLQIDFTNVF